MFKVKGYFLHFLSCYSVVFSLNSLLHVGLVKLYYGNIGMFSNKLCFPIFYYNYLEFQKSNSGRVFDLGSLLIFIVVWIPGILLCWYFLFLTFPYVFQKLLVLTSLLVWNQVETSRKSESLNLTLHKYSEFFHWKLNNSVLNNFLKSIVTLLICIMYSW